MRDTHPHEASVQGLYRQLQDVFENSAQAMYLYLDDVHKVCNQRFADLLGYASPKEWAAVEEPFPMVFAASRSRRALVTAYRNAIERFVGTTLDVTWQTRTGSAVDTTVILVPITYTGHVFALHFISPK